MGPKSLKAVIHTSLSGMGEIERSPYEGSNSAEVGERLFEYTQLLIDPERGLGSIERKPEGGPTAEAIEVFGEEKAHVIQETSRHVASSGIVYGCGWTEGIICGWNCGRLEKELLLLCLCDHRIARSDESGNKRIVKDLDAWKIVSRALTRWKLKEKYPRLARCDNINLFKKRRNNCSKCILFLARAVTCMKYLEWDFLAISDDSSLKTKIYTCFDILEHCVTVEQKKSPQKKPIKKAKPVVEVSTFSSQRSKRLDHNTHKSDQPKNLPTLPLHRSILAKNFFNDKSYSKNSASDLSRRLRCKDSKIVKILLHSVSKKRRRTTDTTKDHNPSCQHTNIKPIQAKKKDIKFSHALFDTAKRICSKNSNERKLVHVPKSFALATKESIPAYVSDGSSMHSGSSDSNFWYPVDENEFILNPLQIETAWLAEESMYCQRSSKIDWIFMLKYASPSLQIELRQISGVAGTKDEEMLSKLLHNGIEAKRFAVLRREIKRKLLKKVVRTRMQGILPRLRMANHPLRRKQMALKKMAVNERGARTAAATAAI